MTVQQTLSDAMSLLNRTAIELMGAGRTDTGVHARQMYAHFDTEAAIDTSVLLPKLNSYLPADIVIEAFIPVADSAHARFDASSRTYEYHIHTFKDAFLQLQSWYCHKMPDVDLMNKAAALLYEQTDFQCFSKSHTDVNTYNCKITRAQWQVHNTKLVFTITADRFLRNMVRAIVGTLIEVGTGKIDLADFIAIIESKDRKNAGFSVPAHGLYLTEIKYPYIQPQTS